MSHPHHSSTRTALSLCLFAGVSALAASGCLDRPLAPQQPKTTRSTVEILKNARIEKIDLLFMIDNSGSMADKQVILAEAVPDLVNRLTSPDCINLDTGDRLAGKDHDTCPEGYAREFKPVEDIHIGIVSSSLDMPGNGGCEGKIDNGLITRNEGETGEGQDIDGQRFIQWNPNDPSTSRDRFAQLVRGVGESGCGFESSLEAWYRFLVDPAPPSTWDPVPCNENDKDNQCRQPGPPDQTILDQRAAFLRQDSLLAIIMLTDENDCSVNPFGQGWYGSRTSEGKVIYPPLSRGTLACDTDPNSPDCKNCADLSLDRSQHPECEEDAPYPDKNDTTNLRCWNQKKRFGADFLHPVERYVLGLTETHIDGVLNPIFCREKDPTDPTGQTCKTALRSPSNVLLGGIVGVPWQDIANNPKDLADGYRPVAQFKMTAAQLAEAKYSVPGGVEGSGTLWDVVLGRTHANHARVEKDAPLDPLMVESVEPRAGTNPALGVTLAPPNSSKAYANPINGHEWNATEEPQFACIFDLKAPVLCDDKRVWCDCKEASVKQNNPLCQDAQGGYSTTQRRAKAYPGLRQLAVLKGIGDQGIAASICPSTMDASRPDYGYRPAVDAIVDRLAVSLGGTCWGEELEADDAGNIPCVVLEATRGEVDDTGNVSCEPCEGIRSDPSSASLAAVKANTFYKDNKMNCLCEVGQASEESGARRACIEEENPDPSHAGWCYVDDSGNPDVLGNCRRMVRFVSEPRPNSLTFIQCRGASY